ncbi:hypothetical protein [Corallococcus sp. AB049A]|uniref:hypothetical protein n=1 Tax=Corallococcus sp. AB049A TaxID=2316721 RepID=UPI001F35D509|nr:hypothetical protein [Corallococcus sp. AB049A]
MRFDEEPHAVERGGGEAPTPACRPGASGLLEQLRHAGGVAVLGLACLAQEAGNDLQLRVRQG